MRRILVVGSSGSGKSVLAAAIAEVLGSTAVELDGLHHGPHWEPRAEFAADVDRISAQSDWVIDGNYRALVGDLLWSRADTVVWLDLPRLLVETRVIRRSWSRWRHATVLWNGNREPGPRGWLTPDHPVRWSWTGHPALRAAYAARFADPALHHIDRYRLPSAAAAGRFLRILRAAGNRPS